jgi:amino acid permease
MAMEGIPLIPGIYSSTRNKKSYKSILVTSLCLDAMMTILMSVIAYLAYRDKIREIVLMSLSYGIFSNIVQLSYSFGILCSFILQFFPVLEILENKEFYSKYISKSMFI